MADSVTLYKWRNTSIQHTASSTTLKDEDFGEPNLTKKVYGVYFTYKLDESRAKNVLLSYVLNGGTSFITTYVPTDTVSASTIWANDSIEFTSPISCQSIRLKFTSSAYTLSINDIGIEYRIIRKRVA